MPVTRSSSRLLTQDAIAVPPSNRDKGQQKNPPTKRATALSSRKTERSKSKTKNAEPSTEANDLTLNESIPVLPDTEEPESFVPAVLTFDFQEAKNHLIGVDHRFEDLFNKMKCKPFEQLEQVHPFRALATSILGQQISWLAARSITHRFIRLYDPSLPEKPDDEQRRAITFFPTPYQVSKTDIDVLRTAGLSARKAEYIRDLATRFADGRLSTKKLLEANDEELAKMLIEWTVDMFAIFSLRRPDILPVGDLGVQRGLVRWFLSLHSPAHSYTISPEKVGGVASKDGAEDAPVTPKKVGTVSEDVEMSVGSSIPPGVSCEVEDLPSIPPPFTPSIKKTLEKVDGTVAPLPSGIDVTLLKGRLNGKNKIKGAILTPEEMAALTECWRPYRSLGVYYMWSLADAV
ncbi:hypothetical protein D9613_000671 [Agrocybe pediades]|uniref:HhH-GPD domain-containing protein n=1 Tax=Agrocybe pediades TaxID=84607 RepID=A0A8H4R2V9_9AGAR|nr:hypothetical protein D9613_000671 [Agrocybe pediades]